MKRIDKDSEVKRKKLKKIGLPCLIIGLLLIIIAFINFISSFGKGMPDLFFLFFIGIPLVFIGGTCLLHANIGKIARYTASQTAPVQKDVVNYLLDETKDNVVDIIKSIDENKKECPYCLTENDFNAQYCKNCGKEICKICTFCNKENDSDAKYCDKCGKEL